ncbi:LacI family DNA-binding transcriptional regulator [Amphibacillus cookii]|uniref:LacI family DNA-binding transcriptional regulator n=1 Tax=Amphibacillus cookii TaxID=767787 RepID=UPI00195D27DD|nr:LacI family DNA-binding transcriptional regulator [Amphibacillus cookii]MBM7541617.1 DNA-binding LacI/PurR family transcriptional regulator [Amphibacillus cookii]
MTNIRDIAKIAGVSVSTVSRVLNHHPYVSEEKRRAVETAMIQTNYHQNMNAIHLSTGKTNIIGVVVPFTNHPYFGKLVEGMMEQAGQDNYKIILFQTNYQLEREQEALDMLKYKQLDGLILCSRGIDWKLLLDYQEYGPIVLAEKTNPQTFSASYIDHYQAFSEALSFLYAKGYRKIGYCVGRQNGANSKQRWQAYQDFLEENALEYNPDYTYYDCYQFEDGANVALKWLEQKNRPEALLVANDQIAAGMVTVCQKHHIDIPRQLALIGFDNQPIAKFMEITTVQLPLFQMGQQLFQQALQADHISEHQFVPKLIERQTV